MALFAGNYKKMSKSKTVINNEFMTPKSAWENIKQYIPKDKVIWEAFRGDGSSAQNLTDLSFNSKTVWKGIHELELPPQDVQ